MNQLEASTLVGMLVTSYPGARFDPASNGVAYETAILDLDARDTQDALAELVRTWVPKPGCSLPSIAEIRGEVFRARKVARDREAVPRLPSGSGFPSPQEWGRRVDAMLTEAERYDRMARRWYAAKGKPYPGDPAAKIIETVKAGARGEHIGDILKRVVIGDMDEQERRHP